MKTVLLLSCGTRNKIVQYFKKHARVIGADCSAAAPALYEADVQYIIPRMGQTGYLDAVLDICRRERVDAVLSLIDPELSVLAQNANAFEAVGTRVVGSSYALCELTLDKYAFYKWLCANGFNCAKSYVDLDEFLAAEKRGEISYPVFVKPVRGSASLNISLAENEETLRFLFGHAPGMMIQQYLRGQEIGADCYIDLISKKCVSVFTKKKLVMRAGETDKAVSFKDEKLFALVKRLAETAGFEGQIDIDIFDVGGTYYISEVNPRFGGGYPHAFECGADHMRLMVNNLEGVENADVTGAYEEGVYMMKYNEVMIKKL